MKHIDKSKRNLVLMLNTFSLLIQMVEQEVRKETEKERAAEDRLDEVDTDDDNDEEEYEAWKIRELKHIKRDREEREA